MFDGNRFGRNHLQNTIRKKLAKFLSGFFLQIVYLTAPLLCNGKTAPLALHGIEIAPVIVFILDLDRPYLVSAYFRQLVLFELAIDYFSCKTSCRILSMFREESNPYPFTDEELFRF